MTLLLDTHTFLWFWWADPQLNPRMGVEYYEQVVEKMGASTGDFFRLFMVPGMFHCGGGVGTGAHSLNEAFDTKDSYIGTQRALLLAVALAR